MSDDLDEEARLLAAVRAAPDDDDARRACAASLDGRGDPRGELMRVEIELMRLRPMVDRLLSVLDAAWLDAVGRHCTVVLVSATVEDRLATVRALREASGLSLTECVNIVDAVIAGEPRVVSGVDPDAPPPPTGRISDDDARAQLAALKAQRAGATKPDETPPSHRPTTPAHRSARSESESVPSPSPSPSPISSEIFSEAFGHGLGLGFSRRKAGAIAQIGEVRVERRAHRAIP